MAQVADLLEWNGGHGKRLTHDLFKFPGKFHPPMVEHVLRSFDPEMVLDPMAGVGTVAIESRLAGIRSLSLDIDPLSVFFARVKSTPLDADELRAAWNQLRPCLEKVSRPGDEIERLQFEDIQEDDLVNGLTDLEGVQFEKDLEALDHWFRNYVLLDYAEIDHSIRNGGLSGYSQRVRRFFLACLLASVRRISNADPSPVSGLEVTKHMRAMIEKGYPIDVLSEFERRVDRYIPAMEEFTNALDASETRDTLVHVHRAPSQWMYGRCGTVDLEPNLIFFSPPYCNAIEYWRRHRLEYILGGFLTRDEIIRMKRDFVGRTVVGGKSQEPPATGYDGLDNLFQELCDRDRVKKAHLLWLYFKDMETVLSKCKKTLPEGGHCVVVVGDSTTRGMQIPTTAALEYLGDKAGLTHETTAAYRIRDRVMQFPTKESTKIENEAMIVFRRDNLRA